MYYNKIISIGSDCSVAGSLRNLKYKDATYPFDWCISKINFITMCFETNFKCYLDIFDKNTNLIKKSGNGHFKYDESIYFYHENIYDNLDNDLLLFYKNKFKRRIERFINLLNSDSKILLVRKSVNEEYNDILKLNKIIKSKYPNINFNILYISPYDHNSVDNVYTYKLPKKCFLHYNDKTDIFTHRHQPTAYDGIYNIINKYKSDTYTQPTDRDDHD